MKFTVSNDSTVFEALSLAYPDCSKTTLRSWLKEGRVLVDGRVVKIGKEGVCKGQVIALGSRSRYIGEEIQILYQDRYLIAIDKPEGLLSVPTAFEKEKTAHAFLKKELTPKKVYIVHRLDQDTSGVMIFALNKEAQERLKDMFKEHAIERRYVAIVEGSLEKKSGTWQSYLIEDANYFVRSTKDKEKGQLAITHYEVRGRSKKHSWLDLRLETGKKNQIRVHCTDAGHPVAGDRKYGAKSNPIRRLCLHACHLSFRHPMTKKILRFDSPVPERFYRIVEPKVE